VQATMNTCGMMSWCARVLICSRKPERGEGGVCQDVRWHIPCRGGGGRSSIIVTQCRRSIYTLLYVYRIVCVYVQYIRMYCICGRDVDVCDAVT
jgi:hypothetical protein